MADVAEVRCDGMSAQLNWACADHASPSECPDALVGRFGSARSYGLVYSRRRILFSHHPRLSGEGFGRGLSAFV